MGGIFGALYLLWIVWAREQVRKDLFEKGFRPTSVRWRPFAYWSVLVKSSFVVKFEDDTGAAGKGRCYVWWDSHVHWVGDDVVYLRKLPLIGRVAYVGIAVFFIQFGIRSLIQGKSIYQFGRKWPLSLPPIPIRGWPEILLSLAALCAAWHLLSHVTFHYDGRNRYRFYALSARSSSLLGWTLFWLSLLVFVGQHLKGL
jgi:hypothetical protein